MNNNTQQQQQQQSPTDPKPKILQSKVLKKVLTQGKPNKKHTLNLHQNTQRLPDLHTTHLGGEGEEKDKTKPININPQPSGTKHTTYTNTWVAMPWNQATQKTAQKRRKKEKKKNIVLKATRAPKK